MTLQQNKGLTLSRRRPISFRNQSIDLLCKSMDWFLYEIGLRRERVKENEETMKCLLQQRKSKKLNHLKYTPKPDSPSQTKEIKY